MKKPLLFQSKDTKNRLGYCGKWVKNLNLNLKFIWENLFFFQKLSNIYSSISFILLQKLSLKAFSFTISWFDMNININFKIYGWIWGRKLQIKL